MKTNGPQASRTTLTLLTAALVSVSLTGLAGPALASDAKKVPREQRPGLDVSAQQIKPAGGISIVGVGPTAYTYKHQKLAKISVNWGDPSSGKNDSSTSTRYTGGYKHTFSAGGTYTVKVILTTKDHHSYKGQVVLHIQPALPPIVYNYPYIATVSGNYSFNCVAPTPNANNSATVQIDFPAYAYPPNGAGDSPNGKVDVAPVNGQPTGTSNIQAAATSGATITSQSDTPNGSPGYSYYMAQVSQPNTSTPFVVTVTWNEEDPVSGAITQHSLSTPSLCGNSPTAASGQGTLTGTG